VNASGTFIRAAAYTSAAMLAFAGNSIICRMALADEAIDPASFTALRLVSGAVALLLIVAGSGGDRKVFRHGSWPSALMLFLYAIGFSYAYIDLDAGTGALILFGFVQGTMIAMAIAAGNRPQAVEWLGWLVATAGLVWLLLPGAAAPSIGGAALMAIAGIAWGVYSIRGKVESDALGATAANFARSVPIVLIIFVVGLDQLFLTPRGVLLALISGALTSGIGYVIWYAALNYLSSIQAALVQLSVPAIAAAGGIMLLAEPLSLRLVVAGTLILGGISLALVGKKFS
jgi:drug/metabolite transporter (DMT)-like permease